MNLPMKPLIVANWKMNPKSLKEAKQLFNSVKKEIKNFKKVEVVICPPFIYIPTFQQTNNPTIKLGAQDCFWEKGGAYTGEVSPSMLKNLGCNYVIIGHSERRKHFKETDDMINKKIKTALITKINPIFCLGETIEERKGGKTQKVLKKQLISGFKNISKSLILNSKFSIAYEPLWAIGTGNPCDFKEAQKINLFLRKFIAQIFNNKLAKKIRIIYGGSVNSKNASFYIKEAKMNGLLVGGASLDAKEFIEIIKGI